MASTLAAGELFTLESLVTPSAQGIASRVLARTAAWNITLFSFDAGEELSEHTAPFDALVLTLSGALTLTSRRCERSNGAADHRADASECSSRCLCRRTLAHAADNAREAPGQGSVPAVTPEVR